MSTPAIQAPSSTYRIVYSRQEAGVLRFVCPVLGFTSTGGGTHGGFGISIALGCHRLDGDVGPVWRLNRGLAERTSSPTYGFVWPSYGLSTW